MAAWLGEAKATDHALMAIPQARTLDMAVWPVDRKVREPLLDAAKAGAPHVRGYGTMAAVRPSWSHGEAVMRPCL
jgi:hypothetical protein